MQGASLRRPLPGAPLTTTSTAAVSSPRARWSGKALFTVSAWGASFVATRVALQTFTPVGLVALRLAMATILLAAAGAALKRRILTAREDLPVCVFLGLVLAAHQLIQAIGLQFTSAINAGWIIAFTPIPLALGGQLVLHQRLSPGGWLGVAVATSGIALIVVSTTPGLQEARTGDLLQLLSCVTWAVYTLAGARVVRRNGALGVNVPATAAGAAVLVLAAGATGFVHADLTRATFAAALFLSLVCSGVGYYLWYKALDEHGAARVGSYLYLEPFVTVVVAAALIGEPIRFPVIGGGLLVLAGVWRVARGTAPTLRD